MLNVDRMVMRDETIHTGPEPPNITNKDVWAQFKIDIAGKEVQTAETYSHSWMANQFGHICLGIVVSSLVGVVLGTGIQFPWDAVAGSLLTAVGVSWWEWRAFRAAVREATGQFPLGRELLRDNAVTAAAYMILGTAITFIYRYFALTPGYWLGIPRLAWAALCFVATALIAVRLAVPWLRQKIVWQKAGLPYLFRLADARPTMDDDDAKNLDGLINSHPPPTTPPCPIVIAGPIGSGRTEFCAGIGTEFAFRDRTVRYLSFTTLLEFAARSRHSGFFDDSGPANIAYWPWAKAQVLIIDDIGPVLIATVQNREYQVELWRQLLNDQLGHLREVLARCHTVWVIGDPLEHGRIGQDDEALDQFADEIRQFCTLPGSPRPKVLLARLDHDAPQRTATSVRVRTRYLD